MRVHPFVAAAVAGISLFLAQESLAVTVPFSENFDSYPIGTANPTDFTQTSGNRYGVVTGTGAGDNDYRATLSATGGGLSASAAVAIPELAGKDFTISTEFSIASFVRPSDSTINLGFGVLGDSGNFSSGSQYRILFTLGSTSPTEAGTINIQNSGTTFSTQVRGTGIPVEIGAAYSLVLTGTYSPAGLTLLATATHLASGATTTTSVTHATPHTGQYFGYRTALNAPGATSTASETINYDNFSVVPEPSIAVALLSGLGFLTLRRRRRS